MRAYGLLLIPALGIVLLAGPLEGALALVVGILATAVALEWLPDRRQAVMAGILATATSFQVPVALAAAAVLLVLWTRERTGSPWVFLALAPLAGLGQAEAFGLGPALQQALAITPWAAALAPALLLVEPNRRVALAGLGAAAFVAIFEPQLAVLSLATGSSARLALRHPANLSWARGSERAAGFLMATPALVLLLAGIANSKQDLAAWQVLTGAWGALLLGGAAFLAFRGSALLFVASEAAASRWIVTTWILWAAALTSSPLWWSKVGLQPLVAAVAAGAPIIVLGAATSRMRRNHQSTGPSEPQVDPATVQV